MVPNEDSKDLKDYWRVECLERFEEEAMLDNWGTFRQLKWQNNSRSDRFLFISEKTNRSVRTIGKNISPWQTIKCNSITNDNRRTCVIIAKRNAVQIKNFDRTITVVTQVKSSYIRCLIDAYRIKQFSWNFFQPDERKGKERKAIVKNFLTKKKKRVHTQIRNWNSNRIPLLIIDW
jgi:carbonic anhydrase